jgi:hypothetical protein
LQADNLKTIPSLNLMIVDEAHHVAAESYKRIIEAAKERIQISCLPGSLQLHPGETVRDSGQHSTTSPIK